MSSTASRCASPIIRVICCARQADLATKRQVWEDMLAVMEKLRMEISEKQRGFFLPKD